MLMHRGGDAVQSEVSALQRRIDALESRVAPSHPPNPVPGNRDLHDPTAPLPSARIPSPELRSDSLADAMPAEQAAPPFWDADAAAQRRQYEAGVLEQALSSQQADVAASNTFAEGLKQAFGGDAELAGNQIVDAQCKVTLCRIAVLQKTDDDVDAFLGQVGSLPGMENTETYWQRQLNADGSSLMTMYVARPGHKLPDYQTHAAEGLASRSKP